MFVINTAQSSIMEVNGDTRFVLPPDWYYAFYMPRNCNSNLGRYTNQLQYWWYWYWSLSATWIYYPYLIEQNSSDYFHADMWGNLEQTARVLSNRTFCWWEIIWKSIFSFHSFSLWYWTNWWRSDKCWCVCLWFELINENSSCPRIPIATLFNCYKMEGNVQSFGIWTSQFNAETISNWVTARKWDKISRSLYTCFPTFSSWASWSFNIYWNDQNACKWKYWNYTREQPYLISVEE